MSDSAEIEFDPTQHRMLEGENAWVNQETPDEDFDLDTPEEKQVYNNLITEVAAANPGLTNNQAYESIIQAEKDNNHLLNYEAISINPVTQQLYAKRELKFRSQLNIATDEEVQELAKIEADYNTAVTKIGAETGVGEAQVGQTLDAIIESNVCQTLEEAENIAINGPVIKGFEDSSARNLLNNGFGIEFVRKSKIVEIDRDDRFFVLVTDKIADKCTQLVADGIATRDEFGSLIFDSEENYLKGAMLLEGVDDPSKVQNTYKNRSAVRSSESYATTILIYNHNLENLDQIEHLKDSALTDEQKTKVYELGTLAHELAHRIHMSEADQQEYARTFVTDQSEGRDTVSEYVENAAAKLPAGELMSEDFCEAVRIYVTNPNYLQANFPARFDFIAKKYPFIKAGAAIESAAKKVE